MNSNNPANRLEAVNLRLLNLGIREADLTEQFIHSGGKGGQNVNKVATAVRLQYFPGRLVRRSGEAAKVEVKCMEERSQALNRVRAREILADRIEHAQERERQHAKAEALRIRKQKAGRPRAIKRQILKDKRKNSQRKQNRTWRPGRED